MADTIKRKQVAKSEQAAVVTKELMTTAACSLLATCFRLIVSAHHGGK